MNIALIGYGKMGKTIEQIAIDRNHHIVARIDADNAKDLTQLLSEADIAIEFTRPDAAIGNIKTCLANNTPIVVGTTGWLEHLEELTMLVESSNGSLLHASNFSIGVNILFTINTHLAKLMAQQADYVVEMREIHHTEKLDEPSGTAISLANQIIEQHPNYRDWNLSSKQYEENSIPIEALREYDVKGTHEVSYCSAVDTLSIKHEAHSRDGFALGAVIAAEWLVNKKGIYTMQDLLCI